MARRSQNAKVSLDGRVTIFLPATRSWTRNTLKLLTNYGIISTLVACLTAPARRLSYGRNAHLRIRLLRLRPPVRGVAKDHGQAGPHLPQVQGQESRKADQPDLFP